MKLKIFLFYFLLSLFLVPPNVLAIECDLNKPVPSDTSLLNEYLILCQQNQQTEQNKVGQYQSAINTIKFKIKITQAQIAQTTAQIIQLEKDVGTLTTVVSDLDKSLNDLTKVFLARVRAGYMRRSVDSTSLFFSSESFAKFFTRIQYLSIVKARDQLVLNEMESARKNYDNQKREKQEKQKEVEILKTKLVVQQKSLSSQQADLQNLITVSQGNANKYAELLKQAKEELEALANSHFTVKKDIKRGDPIGLMGTTGNSTGPHLHFGLYNRKENEVDHLSDNIDWYWNSIDPTSILERRGLVFLDTSCDDVSQQGNKDIGTGSQLWPLSNPYITQCWGHTPWSFKYNTPTRGHFHDGLDIAQSGNIVVRAIDDGVAYFYRDEKTGFGNNVRIFHSNGKMSLYLHLQ